MFSSLLRTRMFQSRFTRRLTIFYFVLLVLGCFVFFSGLYFSAEKILLEDPSRFLVRLQILFAWATLGVILLSAFGALLLTDRLMRPVRKIIQAIKNLDEASLANRVSVAVADPELQELQNTFNQLLGRIEYSVHSLKEAFDHLAHDMRTPVTRLRGQVEMALNRAKSPDDYREALQSCYENSDRILKFLENITSITEAENRTLNIRYTSQSLGAMVQEMMDLYEIAFEERDIQVKQILFKNDQVPFDPNLVRRVIANLLDNAYKYTPVGGEIVVETYRTDKHVVLSVRDSGMGIPEKEQALIWERLYRGDKSRTEHGMGLGLTFVKAVVEAHGGAVNVISPIHQGHGSEFLVKFRHQDKSV